MEVAGEIGWLSRYERTLYSALIELARTRHGPLELELDRERSNK